MQKIFFKRKFYKNFFVRFIIKVTVKIACFFDYLKDKKVCGCSLVKYVPSLYRETLGATGSQATCYWALDEIFLDDTFTEHDKFVDVGCGKGRVLAYLIKNGAPCSLTGIELNKDVAEYAQAWVKRYDNVKIVNANAFDIDYNEFTVLFLGRPFETEVFYKFVNKLEETLNHKIKLYYWWDTQSGAYLENRPGWKGIRRRWIFMSHGLFMYSCPQRYTVWEYTPQKDL